MEVAERLWLDCDIDGALREVSAVLTAQDKSKTDVNNALLLSAHIHFYLGKLRQSNELLNQSMIMFLIRFPNEHLQQRTHVNTGLDNGNLHTTDTSQRERVNIHF